jgi:guanylate kinase
MKSGKHRKYIPVISGAPGVGKTSMIDMIAQKNNLIAVDIDSSRLLAEDVIGMPVQGKRDEEKRKIEVKFTPPQLFQQIINKIEDSAEEHFEKLVSRLGDEEAQEEFAKWEQQTWKYLLFFDELNRVDTKTFNALRRIILEKNFGPASDGKGGMLHLPDGSIVVGALNPDRDTGGTQSMTGHFRDVVDVINATSSWTKTRQFLLNKSKQNTGWSDAAVQASMFVIDEFAKKFADKNNDDKEQAPYYIQSGANTIYVSPREYDALFSSMVPALDEIKDEILADVDITEEEGIEEVRDVVADAMKSGLLFPAEKTEAAAPEEFVSMVSEWVSTMAKDVYGMLITKKVMSKDTWAGTLNEYITGARSSTKMPQDTNINNRVEATNAAQFVEEVSTAIADALQNEKQFKEIALKQNEPKVALKGEKIAETEEKTHRLGNIVMSLLYTLHIHDYQNDRIMAIGKALFRAAKQTMKGLSGLDPDERRDLIVALSELRSDVHEALVEIKRAN